jgi:hypothetical protein
MRAVKAGVIYFLLLFAVGWILGPIRELWAVPHFGRTVAMLSEAVIMLITMIVTARWVIRRFAVPQALGARLSMGLIAIGLLFPAEIAGVVWVRRLSLQEYLASFGAFAGVPACNGRFRGRGGIGHSLLRLRINAGFVLDLSIGDREARADCECGELIDRVAAGAPVRELLVIEALGHTRLPLAHDGPDHHGGTELAVSALAP